MNKKESVQKESAKKRASKGRASLPTRLQAGIRLQSELGNPPGVLFPNTPGGLPDRFMPLRGKNL
ncbi:MAG: hypothetical protein QM537_09675, partial [Candidatus Symbiobacter sp.]|nr:hypothetical protein [Candidatus Symbiobacter sp.]